MGTRVLHLSDLHVGSRVELEVAGSLAALIERAEPELIVVSGDLTHRGRTDQHERAAAFLRGLGPPVLAVPGNHDIPHTVPARFTGSFAAFERFWETSEPAFSSPALHVVGLNSARPWRHQSGGLSTGRLERACRLLGEAPDGALRVVVLHHHLIGAPWRSRKRPVARRGRVLAALVESGAELILGGHTHQSAVSERREFAVSSGGEAGVTICVAPGLGRPRPHRLGEARGLNLYDVDRESLRVLTYVWNSDGFGLAADRRFPRGGGPLSS